MATLRELIIKISANSRSFQSEISRASRMGQDYYRTMQNGGRQSAAASREMRRALAEVTDQINTAKSSALNMAGAFAGAFATGHLISLADEWNSVNARLKQASQSSDDFQSSQRELMAISQRTGTAFSDNASLFARSAASMREYGYSSEEVLKVTEAISTGLKLSGASTAEASSVITQFSQALAQGVLRGEEFNSVNENGDRVIRALAAGMGVARKDLKAMADNGKLTADKVVPALISQLGALRDEYAAMPDTVSSSATKVENAFMAWVGGANEASGVTKTLSGVLNGLAGNIDTVATAAGALVAVGVARYFGNMASSAGSATAGLITAARNEVALAEAQLRGTQIATARARAAVYRAQQAVVAARGTERQAAAEAKLTAAQASLTRNIAARTAAQTTLNTVTSVGSRLLSGALGLVGGVPGLVMLGATAWYTMYQNQEQARESARQYAATIDEIRQKTSAMSLPEASDNEEKTRQALDEQNRLIDEQKSKIKSLQEKIAGYQYVLANPGWTTDNGFMINHMTSVKTVTEGLAEATNQLAVEQSRLTQMQGKAQSIQDVLAGLEERRVALIRQQAAEQNKAYQSLLIMNGQHTEFNRLLGLGNELLQQRQGLVNVPLRLPQADAVVSTMDGLVSNISDALAGNVVDWRNWGSSVLREVSKILMNAAIVNGLKSLSGAGGWLGTVGGWISGAVANAKGGVYTSANLSAYSNTIVDTPTYFAFAKGAGLMGEAGPEAIMPLTRAADGSLGVRAIGNVNGGGGFVYSPVYHISIQNQGSNGEIDARSARGLVDLIDSRVVSIMQSSRRDGGLYSA
ncbi:phage tail tape measure protein [Escherichia coli]|nr:phage tail tape measure protein [Escherichia coli]HBM8250429.1 phage tail tape measure protein [Escherichia coli]